MIFVPAYMKRFIITILAVFYLGVASGATVHFHYCMGQLIEWGLSNKEADKCGNCGMNKPESTDCCKDQHQNFKVEKSQKASQNVYQFNLPLLKIPLTAFNEHNVVYVSSLKEEHHFSNAPLRKQNIPVFVRNCNFRI